MWSRAMGQTSPSTVANRKGVQGQVITRDTLTVRMSVLITLLSLSSVHGCRERLKNAQKISYST